MNITGNYRHSRRHSAGTHSLPVVYGLGFRCSGLGFQVGVVNTNSCPLGSTRITDEATCRAAAIARGAEFKTETSPQYPTGCQTYQNPNEAVIVYLNCHPTGVSEANSAPLCRTGVATAQPQFQVGIVNTTAPCVTATPSRVFALRSLRACEVEKTTVAVGRSCPERM